MTFEAAGRSSGVHAAGADRLRSNGELPAVSGEEISTDKVREAADSQIFGLTKPGLPARMMTRSITGSISIMRDEMISPGCINPRLNWLPRLSSATQVPRGRRLALFGRGCLALFFALVFGVATAQAQTAVCSNTPAVENWIACTEDATSTDDITINAKGVDIDTTGDDAHGVFGEHSGTGNVDIDITSAIDSDDNIVRSTIDTTGDGAHGVFGWHLGDAGGAVDIDVQFTTIITTGAGAHGVVGWHRRTSGAANDVAINVLDGSITTTGSRSHGIYGDHQGPGNITIDVEFATIKTSDLNNVGDTSSHGIYGNHISMGNVDIDIRGGSITTKGEISHGVYAYLCLSSRHWPHRHRHHLRYRP